MLQRLAQAALILILAATAAWAEVGPNEIRRRDDADEPHQRIIARVHFTADPRLACQPRNRGSGPGAPQRRRTRRGSAGDLLFFQPKEPARARGAVLLEVVNRGRDQALGLMSGAVQRSLVPESWSMGDGFLLERGFAVAFLGWQFDVTPAQGLTFQAPVAPVDGQVRASAIVTEAGPRATGFALPYCAATQNGAATMTYRQRIDAVRRSAAAGGLALQAIATAAWWW